jgi:hypothetical protein
VHQAAAAVSVMQQHQWDSYHTPKDTQSDAVMVRLRADMFCEMVVKGVLLIAYISAVASACRVTNTSHLAAIVGALCGVW